MKSKGNFNQKKGNFKKKFKKPFGNKDEKKKKQQQPQNRKTKLHIKFNNEDRRDYLKGFQKRKNQRRKEAFEKMEKDLKKEMTQIRNERKQMMKKLLNQEIPDFTKVDDSDEEYNSDENPDTVVTTCGSATVEISELNLSSPLTLIPNTVPETVEKEENDRGLEDKNEEDSIPHYTKQNLLELGIFTEKDLKKSVRQNAAQLMKANKLMKKKEARHAKAQRKEQRRKSNARKKMRTKKMKRRQGGKPRRDD